MALSAGLRQTREHVVIVRQDDCIVVKSVKYQQQINYVVFPEFCPRYQARL